MEYFIYCIQFHIYTIYVEEYIVWILVLVQCHIRTTIEGTLACDKYRKQH